VGSGAFAMENARTALIHGAEHVTLVYRRSFQCWPRVVHYLASMGNMPMKELAQHYDAFVAWAGMAALPEEDRPHEFWSLKTFSQPTASDFVFAAHRAGRLTIKKGEVAHLETSGVVLKGGQRYNCGVFVKCVGWELPELRQIYPAFQNRNWIFLDGHRNMSFMCDPHYQMDDYVKLSDKQREMRYQIMMEQTISGGTFSCMIQARIQAVLQLYMMHASDWEYSEVLRQLPTKTTSMGSWFELKTEFSNLARLNSMIKTTLNEKKKAMRRKFHNTAAFAQMARERLQADLERIEGLDEAVMEELLHSYPLSAHG